MQPGDMLCDVETDKATMGWENQDDGFIAKILKVLCNAVCGAKVVATLVRAFCCSPHQHSHRLGDPSASDSMWTWHAVSSGCSIQQASGSQDVPVGTPVLILVEEQDQVAAFADYQPEGSDSQAQAAEQAQPSASSSDPAASARPQPGVC